GKQGCDASVLLDDTSTFRREKTAGPKNASLRGFDVVDSIKSQLESICPGVVSCAENLAVAARDSIVALVRPSRSVQFGRKYSSTASLSAANSNIPSPAMSLDELIFAFSNKGLNDKDMITLSDGRSFCMLLSLSTLLGSHTIGLARCITFRDRIYNEANIDTTYATSSNSNCPSSGGDDNLSPLDASSPATFDNAFYKNLIGKKGPSSL
ncbi:hem peroxidase, partial [Dillenia turbinata]